MCCIVQRLNKCEVKYENFQVLQQHWTAIKWIKTELQSIKRLMENPISYIRKVAHENVQNVMWIHKQLIIHKNKFQCTPKSSLHSHIQLHIYEREVLLPYSFIYIVDSLMVCRTIENDPHVDAIHLYVTIRFLVHIVPKTQYMLLYESRTSSTLLLFTTETTTLIFLQLTWNN